MTNLTNTDYELWIDAKKQLDHWKKAEMELRVKLSSSVIPSVSSVGTHNFDLGHYSIKVVVNMRTTIDADLLDIVWDSLSAEEKDCVKFKPTLKKREFDNLPNITAGRTQLDDTITLKPAPPTLSIVHTLEA